MPSSGQTVACGHEKVQSSLQALGAKPGMEMGKQLNDKATRHVLGRQEATLHPQRGPAPCIDIPRHTPRGRGLFTSPHHPETPKTGHMCRQDPKRRGLEEATHKRRLSKDPKVGKPSNLTSHQDNANPNKNTLPFFHLRLRLLTASSASGAAAK